MAANPATGPSAMPYVRDNKAPHFSGEVGEQLDDFLREYEELATTCVLTDQQKVETILRYVPPKLQDLWKNLEGYSIHDWPAFKRSLESVYRATSTEAKYSKDKLYDFVFYNSQYRMRSEDDVHRYYREFFVYCLPLLNANEMTTGDRDSAFWFGFHPEDRSKLSFRLLAKLPNQRSHKHFAIEEVFTTALSVFGSTPYIPIELRERWEQHGPHLPRPDQPYEPWHDEANYNPRMTDHEGRFREREHSYPRSSNDRGRGRPSHHHYAPPTHRGPENPYQTPSLPHAHDHGSYRSHGRSPSRTRHVSPPRARDHSPTYARERSPPRAHDRSLPHARDPSPPRARPPSPPRPSVETRTVRFKEPTREEEDRELDDLMEKLHGLSIRERSYAVLYARCVHRFPDVAKGLAPPELHQSFAFQNTPAVYQNPHPTPPPLTSAPRQPWTERAAPPLPPAPSEPVFLTARCIFCSQTNHRIKECPIAQEYIRSGKAVVIENRIHLPNGQPIPTNITGRNLQARIDTWIAGTVAAAPTHPSEPSFTREPPPHAAHCFEIVEDGSCGPPVQQAHIVEIQDNGSEWDDDDNDDDDDDDEVSDLFEVYATERRKRDAKVSQLPEFSQAKVSKEHEGPIIPPITVSDSMPSNKLPLASALPNVTSSSEDKTPSIALNAPPPIAINNNLPNSSTLRAVPQYRYQSLAEDQQLMAELLRWLLDGRLSLVTPAHILAASPGIRKELAERLKLRRVDTANLEESSPLSVPTTPCSVLKLSSPRIAEYSLPLREIDVLVNDTISEAGILDQGSQIIVIRQDLAQEAGVLVNHQHQLEMEGANGLVSKTIGCAENLTMQVGDVAFEVHAHIVERAPFRLLLGRPFHHLLLCKLEDHPDGRVDVSVRDPTNPTHFVTIPSRARKAQVGLVRTLALGASPPIFKGLRARHTLVYRFLNHSLPERVLAYKKVDRKVRPVAASLPEDYRIIRRIPIDPLLSLPPLPPHPPDFTPGTRLTQERLDDLDLNRYGFLWPEELKLLTHILRVNELGLAWTEAEKGRFRDDYVSPVKIPVIEHVPWAQKNIPIPTGILEQVIQIFRDKFAAGVYEHSDASYRSRWFCVEKKNGSLRLVHDLQPLNAVTVRNSGVPPLADQLIEAMAGRSCYSMLDLFVGYDHRTLDVSSRDLTTIQSPIGALRLTCLPQGWTNAVAIFHEDVTFILEAEIPHVAWPFVDDCSIKGPASRFETEDGGFETIPDNPGIRKFIWQHLNDVHRILHRLSCAGATVSAKKLFVAVPEVVILGHKCNYEGRIPDDSKIARIRDWPSCKDISDVRGFLGLTGYMRIWIKNYSAIARPLVNLTRKGETFTWEDQHADSMQRLKNAIVNSPALISIDYSTDRPVFLAVDSSFRGVGWILSQECADGKRRPSRFGSISWNERESNYSQPKIELFGLFRALRALRLHLIGVRNLVVEMDAVFIRGMLNNPDVQPNAVINRWIAAILLFDFKLVHVPADKHQGPDGLSRREPMEGEDDEEDPEDWIDRTLGLGIWTTSTSATFSLFIGNASISVLSTKVVDPDSTHADPPIEFPSSDKSRDAEAEMMKTQHYLETLRKPLDLNGDDWEKFFRRTKRYYLLDGRLWRHNPTGRDQLFISPSQRLAIVRAVHDDLGHKGIYSTRRTLLDRFWWPSLDQDVKWYINTCHQCQLRQTTKVRIPPVVPLPAPLFRKVYIDTMHMTPAAGFKYIIQARCSLTAWPEWRALRTETGTTIGRFIFEEILCRWGAVEEIVTDNGSAYIAALDWLANKYDIRHIRISAYNSRANGIVERQHRTIRESLLKTCEGEASKWPAVAPHVFWADRVTTRRSTGHSPFFMTHGVEPILPFDITLATFLIPNLTAPLSTSELITTRARQLQTRESDLADVHNNIVKSRFSAAQSFERQFANTIKANSFTLGDLVLVRNSATETTHQKKMKPRYFGPMVVVKKTRNGAYRLAELDGAVSRLRFAAFRLVPYHTRSRSVIPVTRLLDSDDLNALNKAEEDSEEADEDL